MAQENCRQLQLRQQREVQKAGAGHWGHQEAPSGVLQGWEARAEHQLQERLDQEGLVEHRLVPEGRVVQRLEQEVRAVQRHWDWGQAVLGQPLKAMSSRAHLQLQGVQGWSQQEALQSRWQPRVSESQQQASACWH
jgi:hypothetical protein